MRSPRTSVMWLFAMRRIPFRISARISATVLFPVPLFPTKRQLRRPFPTYGSPIECR